MSDDETLIGGIGPGEANVPRVPELEEITVRQISMGFAGGGVQDMVLYPEDSFEADDKGNIKITYGTMPGRNAEFVAYAGHTQWHSYREIPHRRVKGSLRPDPMAMMQEFQARREKEIAERKLAPSDLV